MSHDNKDLRLAVMTPFTLDILLHYYVYAEDHEVVRNNPPIWSDTRRWFYNNGLLEESTNPKTVHQITKKGKVYIREIMKTPLPVQVWVILDRASS